MNPSPSNAIPLIGTRIGHTPRRLTESLLALP